MSYSENIKHNTFLLPSGTHSPIKYGTKNEYESTHEIKKKRTKIKTRYRTLLQ